MKVAPPAAERRRRTISAAALATTFALFPLTPSFVDFAAIRPPGLSIVTLPFARVVLALALVAALAILLTRDRTRDPARPAAPTALRTPLLVSLATIVLAALLGLDPVTGLLMTSALAIAAVVHAGVLRDGDLGVVVRAIYAAFLASATAASVVGVVLWATDSPPDLARLVNGRATGTFVVPGEFAGYLVLALATAAGVAAAYRGPLRLLAWATLATGIPALAATSSRAGWFGASVAMAAIVAVERPRLRVVATLVVLLAVEARVLMGFEGQHNPSEEFVRFPIWIAAARAASLFPLTGTGPGGFRELFPTLRPPTTLVAAYHAHSAILGSLVETGCLGFAASLWLWGRFANRTCRALLRPAGRRRQLGLALAAGLLGTAVQATVDSIQVLALGCWLPFMALALVEAAA